MGWNDEETGNVKKGMSTSSKILLLMIGCILLIIMLLIMLLMTTKETTFKIYVDGVVADVTEFTLLNTINDVTYVNIEEFSKLVGYEYHKGEYRASIIEEDKCYVEGKKETASFYLGGKKVYKLAVGKQSEQYEEYIIENAVQTINEKMYVPLEAISKAFNVLISETDNALQIYTLEYLMGIYDVSVQNWGYETIKEQSFENQKALLYGYLIVKKQGTEEAPANGLYKIIDTNNTKEIVLDRYISIEFSENIEGFFVTDASKKVGIVNFDGSAKIENVYDSISLIDKEEGLYIVELNKKYGVVSDKGASVIYPEYESVGVTGTFNENKYLILNELIPVCKEKKWGAFDKKGNLILDIVYDELGYSSTSVEINGVKELVKPILSIEKANGIVVKKLEKYGLLDAKGKELVPIAVDAIYAVNGAEDEYSRYFMLYNGEELNVIERLIRAGLIEEKEDIPNEDENIVENNTINSEDNTAGNNIANQ